MASATKPAPVGLKYANKHVSCRDQPCPDLDESDAGELMAYRMIAKEAPTPDDFLPLAETPRGDPNDGRCAAWGLSFFVSKQATLSAWGKVQGRGTDHAKRFSHVAEIALLPTDGLIGRIDGKGHFCFHPSTASRPLHAHSSRVSPLAQQGAA